MKASLGDHRLDGIGHGGDFHVHIYHNDGNKNISQIFPNYP